MSSGKYVQVLLPLPVDQEFTYQLPDTLIDRVQPGARLLVPFGSRKILSGIVRKILREKPEMEIKTVLELLDEEPIVTQYQFQFWEWMADYYLCTMGEVMKAALPAGLKLESNTRILTNDSFETSEAFSELEELAWLYLRKNQGTTIRELGDLLKRKNPLPIIHQLSKKGAILLEERLTDSFKPKTETWYQLSADQQNESSIHAILDELTRAPKQRTTIELLIAQQAERKPEESIACSRKNLLAAGASTNALESLVSKQILLKQYLPISRIGGQEEPVHDAKKLNTEQQEILHAISTHSNESVHLLHGVTSSGKTEIYIHLIKDVLENGNQALYLLPEIALTEQIINRLREIFGNKIGVFHSRYSDSERIELWNDLLSKDNKYKLILGARSALFLPFTNLDLIIVDEEHESSFKQQDPAPRYHARDAAIVLSKIHQSKIILGTATPSLESYFNAKTGKYILHELKTRHGHTPLPEILIANAKDAYRKKRIKGHLTPELMEAIDQALLNKEQIILFQNRRGYSPFLECDTCGHVPKCRDCDVSLTLHKYKSRMVCHYCGYTEPVSDACPKCLNNSLRTRGLGTEGLEEEIHILFPTARLSRLDLETSRSRKSYVKIIHDFELGKTDILIGTQMVTKGLDFSKVRVVGIINADNLLHFPDFRSFERSYQLMTQVSGRAGRRKDRGLVIIQTFDPSHRIIQQVVHQDFKQLYASELQDRKDFGYPPFTRLIRLNIKHKDPDLSNRCAYYLAKELKLVWETKVLGPQSPGISRVQNLHIRQILIKSSKGSEHKKIRQFLKEIIRTLKSDPTFRSVIIQADVDPL